MPKFQMNVNVEVSDELALATMAHVKEYWDDNMVKFAVAAIEYAVEHGLKPLAPTVYATDADDEHGPYCSTVKHMNGERIACGLTKGHRSSHSYVRGLGKVEYGC